MSIVISVALLSAVFTSIPLNCFSEEGTTDAAKLINEAHMYLQEGDKEKAISALDEAFEAADSAGDYESLMEIGDLYIAIDTSLEEKAMKAWTRAGSWRCQ